MANVPLHLVAARLRPPPVAPADADEDWDAVIARAKRQAAWAEMAPTPPPRSAWAEMAPTPPPALGRLNAPRPRSPQATRATLDALVGRVARKPAKRT